MYSLNGHGQEVNTKADRCEHLSSKPNPAEYNRFNALSKSKSIINTFVFEKNGA